jgi:hypothetical protein
VNHSPEVHLEQLPHILDGHFGEPTIKRYPSIVDPGVQRAELLDRPGSKALYVIRVRNIGNDCEGRAATLPDLRDRLR